MSSKVKAFVKAHKTPIIVAALLVLTVSGAVTSSVSWLTKPLMESNNAYLNASLKDTTQLMIPVGIAKAGADLVEGSTFNVEAGVIFAKAGMNIEVGDTLQPVLDYIDVAWRLLLISLVYLVSAKSILAGAMPLAQPLLVVSLVAYLLNSLLAYKIKEDNPVRHSLKRIGPLFLLCALLFALILPLTVAGAAYLARHTTDPLREGMWQSFDKISTVFSMEKFHEAEEMKEKTIVLKDKIVEIGRYSSSAIGDVASSVCKLAAIKLLNGIIFPLTSLAFLIWIVRGCLYPALGLSKDSLSSADLRLLMNWVGKQHQTPASGALSPPNETPLADGAPQKS